MKALTVRQPWAWSIFNAGKDVENRSWYTPLRGRVAIHAAQVLTRQQYKSACKYIRNSNRQIEIPSLECLQRGAILGVVEITDCVRDSDSMWFEGRYGLVLARPKLLSQPIRCKGGLKLWYLPEYLDCRINLDISSSEENAHYPHTKRPRNSRFESLTRSTDWSTPAGPRC